MGFMLEASFLGIMLFGWHRVGRKSPPLRHGHGRLRSHPLGLLDHGRQFVDADPGRRRLRRRSLCHPGPSHRHFQPQHALGRLSHVGGFASVLSFCRRRRQRMVPSRRQGGGLLSQVLQDRGGGGDPDHAPPDIFGRRLGSRRIRPSAHEARGHGVALGYE